MRLLILLSLVIGSAWAICGCGEKPASGPPPAAGADNPGAGIQTDPGGGTSEASATDK